MNFDYENIGEEMENISEKKIKLKNFLPKKISKKSVIIALVIIFISTIFIQRDSYNFITRNLAEIQKTIIHLENVSKKNSRTSKANKIVELQKEVKLLDQEIKKNSKYWH